MAELFLVVTPRGGPQPLRRVLEALLHAVALVLQLGQERLGLDVVLLGCGAEPPGRFGSVVFQPSVVGQVHLGEPELGVRLTPVWPG